MIKEILEKRLNKLFMDLDIQKFASSIIDGSSTASNCSCRIVWSSTLNAGANTSNVYAEIQIYKSGGSSNATKGTFSGNIYIDGTAQWIEQYSSWAWGSWHTVGSFSKTVTHNENGQKTISISGNLTQTGTSMAGYYEAGGNAVLDTNNRASVLGNILNFGINDTITIPITKYVGSFTDKLVISNNGTTIKTIDGITNDYNLTFTTGEKNTILGLMTSPQIQLKFTLSTFDGATQIGSSSIKYANVTSLDKPVLFNYIRKSNGNYQMAINGTVNDNAGPLQVYDDNGDDVFGKNIITLSATVNQSVTIGGSFVEVTLNNVFNVVGTKLSKSGNAVLIGAGVKKILASANAWADDSGHSYVWLRIVRAGVQIIGNNILETPGTFKTLSITPMLVSVAPGDLISMSVVFSGANANNRLAGGTYVNSVYLTVEVVE